MVRPELHSETESHMHLHYLNVACTLCFVAFTATAKQNLSIQLIYGHFTKSYEVAGKSHKNVRKLAHESFKV